MPMVMPSMIGLNSSRPNMVMARLSDGEKRWRLAMAVRNWVIAAASKPGATRFPDHDAGVLGVPQIAGCGVWNEG